MIDRLFFAVFMLTLATACTASTSSPRAPGTVVGIDNLVLPSPAPTATPYLPIAVDAHVSLQTSTARSSILAGGNYGDANGRGELAQFGTIHGMALDRDGSLIVADGATHSIRKVTMDGEVTTLAGTGREGRGDGAVHEATFSSPRDIAVDGQGSIYVADYGNGRLRKITAGGLVSTLTRTRGWYPSPDDGLQYDFKDVRGIAVQSDGTVFTTDASKNVYQVDPSGHISIFIDSSVHLYGGPKFGSIWYRPDYLGLNSESRLFMSIDNFDAGGVWYWHSQNAIEKMLLYKYPDQFLDGPKEVASCGKVTGFDFDSEGNVFFCDSSNNSVREITKGGVVRTLIGDGKAGNILGIATEARLNDVEDLVVGKDGNLYVADAGNRRILKITLR